MKSTRGPIGQNEIAKFNTKRNSYNLVSNAVKFTKEGGITIRAELTPQGDHVAVVLIVQDTGTGIPDEAKPQMFQAFSKADESTTRHFA
ncbi:MAG: ATP-binding protein [Bdellovibrionia bacterium]